MLQCSGVGRKFIIEWAPLVISYQILCPHLHPCLKMALSENLDYQILNHHCLQENQIKLVSKEKFQEQKGKRNEKAQCDLLKEYL